MNNFGHVSHVEFAEQNNNGKSSTIDQQCTLVDVVILIKSIQIQWTKRSILLADFSQNIFSCSCCAIDF